MNCENRCVVIIAGALGDVRAVSDIIQMKAQTEASYTELSPGRFQLRATCSARGFNGPMQGKCLIAMLEEYDIPVSERSHCIEARLAQADNSITDVSG